MIRPCIVVAVGLLMFTRVVSAQNPWADQLLAYWSFDDGKGPNVADYAGMAPGTRRGDTKWLTGTEAKFGSAMRFNDGGKRNKGYVSLAPSEALARPDANAMTVSAWVRSDVPVAAQPKGGYSSIFQSTPHPDGKLNDNFIAYYDFKTGNVRVKFTTDMGSARPAIAGGEIPVGQWFNIVGVYDGSKVAVYLNGVKKEEAPLTGKIVEGYSYAIGRKGETDKEYWVGDMDDIAIWRRALSPAEIAKLAEGRTAVSQLLDGAKIKRPAASTRERLALYYFYLPSHQPSIEFYEGVMRKPANYSTVSRYNVAPVDMESNAEQVAQYGVFRSPTILLTKPDGTEVGRLSGVPAESEFLATLSKNAR